jgi:hypothetical protein
MGSEYSFGFLSDAVEFLPDVQAVRGDVTGTAVAGLFHPFADSTVQRN